jgi:hypothetical protein
MAQRETVPAGGGHLQVEVERPVLSVCSRSGMARCRCPGGYAASWLKTATIGVMESTVRARQ